MLGEDIGGLAVHIGARVCALAGPGEILVTAAVKDLVVGSRHTFAGRGEHQLKGVPGRWHVYAVRDEAAVAPAPLAPPAESMTAADRMAVRLARRAPGTLRALGRMTQRR